MTPPRKTLDEQIEQLEAEIKQIHEEIRQLEKELKPNRPVLDKSKKNKEN